MVGKGAKDILNIAQVASNKLQEVQKTGKILNLGTLHEIRGHNCIITAV